MTRRTSKTSSGLRFEAAAYKPVSFDSSLPSTAMVVSASSVIEPTPLDRSPLSSKATVSINSSLTESTLLNDPLITAIVSTNNSTSLDTSSNLFTAEERYSLVKSIRDNEHFTSIDKMKFIKVLLTTEFFEHKYNYIQICKLYGGDQFTTLQALGGYALNVVEETTLPVDGSSPVAGSSKELDIVECNSFLTDGNLRKLTGLEYESNRTQLIKTQTELTVNPLNTYHSLEEALTKVTTKVVKGFYNRDQANMNPQYAEDYKHPVIGNANPDFVTLHDSRLLENHDPTRDSGLECFEASDQRACTRTAQFRRENCAVIQFKGNKVTAHKLLDYFQSAGCRHVLEQQDSEAVYVKYNPKSDMSLQIRKFWLNKYFHLKDCVNEGSYAIINCQSGEFYRGISSNLGTRENNHWVHFIRNNHSCDRLRRDIETTGIDNFIFVITGGVCEENPEIIGMSIENHRQACHDAKNQIRQTQDPLIKDEAYMITLAREIQEGMVFIGQNNFWPDVDELSGDARIQYEKLPKKASPWQYKGVRELDEKKLVNSNGMLNIYRPKDDKSVSVLYNTKKNLNLGTLVEQALLEQNNWETF